MIKLGKRSLETRKPADLDAAVGEVSGLSGGEMAAMLGRSPLAGTLAAALAPFLKEPVALGELAGWIAEAGIEEARAAVLELYTKVADAKEA